MRSFTDIFIKHPVLAVVVNLVILLVGYRSISSLPVQQYPKIESSQILITTVYYGASAETVRGFLTTPIERAVSAISGVDYVESTSRAGVSSITIHLKLNHNSTTGLAEVTARLQQVRAELPAEAQPPVVEVQRADRPYASFYMSFTSSARDIPALTDWLTRNMQPQLSTLSGVQRVDVVGGTPIAMRIWIDPDKLAALNLAPGDVQAALQRNNFLAAVGQTKNDLVQVNLLANTDLRSPEEFKNLIVADRNGAVVRLSDVAKVELGAEEADFITKFSDKEAVYLGIWPVIGVNEIEGRPPAARRDGQDPADAAQGHRHAAGVRRHGVHGGRAARNHQDVDRDDPDRRRRGVPLHGVAAHRDRAARGHPDFAGGCGDRDVRRRIQPQPPHHSGDRTVGRSGGRRRHRRGRERRATRERG
jgi:multidrug efflux pump